MQHLKSFQMPSITPKIALVPLDSLPNFGVWCHIKAIKPNVRNCLMWPLN